MLGYGKNRKQIPQWRRERKTVFPEGNNRGGGQGRPRMASPGAQEKSGHEYLARRWEELTAPGSRSWVFCVWTLLVVVSDRAGDVLKQSMDVLNQRHDDKLYRTLVL